jgi:hypothetical protein
MITDTFTYEDFLNLKAIIFVIGMAITFLSIWYRA